MSDGSTMGRRIREIRTWRDLTQRATAELAGISPAYLSMIESGERTIERRATLEAIARALRVSPVELGAMRLSAPLDPDVAVAMERVTDLEAALTDVEFGEVTVAPRAWAEVHVDVARLQSTLRLRADIAGQMSVMPTLIRELNALHAGDLGPRVEVLDSLIHVLRFASLTAKQISIPGLPALAALRMRTVAEHLDEPCYHGLARLGRIRAMSTDRNRMRELCLAAADDLQAGMDENRVRELYGVLHLNAAMAAAVMGDADGAGDHLREASDTACRVADPAGCGWADLNFNRTNVQFWEVATTVELGNLDRVPSLSDTIRPEAMASWSRQAAYFVDLGRALAADKSRRGEAVTALTRAESLAPVQTRTDIWVRETVTSLLARSRRDETTGRELRGLAYRIGLAA